MNYVKKHNRAAVAAGRRYAENDPFSGKYAERVDKLDAFIKEVLDAYCLWTPVVFDPKVPTAPAKTRAWYDLGNDTIVVTGGFSVLATLDAVARAIEADRDHQFSGDDLDGYARRWSHGLFAKLFPAEWEELVINGSDLLTRSIS
jgi:phosphoserine phosphatase